MSLVQSIRYVCNKCKQPFRYDNQCRCKMCGLKIDAEICKSCHTNSCKIAIFGISAFYSMSMILQQIIIGVMQ